VRLLQDDLFVEVLLLDSFTAAEVAPIVIFLFESKLVDGDG
jgi:hypothetical protein